MRRFTHAFPSGGFLLAAFCVMTAGCGGSSSAHTTQNAAPLKANANTSSTWKIVALGDSDTTGEGDTTGVGWVERYARLLRGRQQAKIDVTNLAKNGKTSAQLLSDVRADPTIRRQIAGANVILLGIGGADLNTGDANLQAGRCRGRACYTPVLNEFAHNFQATVEVVRELRGSRPTILRAITLPNGVPGARDVIPAFVTPAISLYQAHAEKQAICLDMARYQGRCIDLLNAFNGRSGTENAYKKGLMNHHDCCYPTAEGQQRIAELLLQTGLAPLA